MLLSNFYKCVQSIITQNNGDSYAEIRSYTGTKTTAKRDYLDLSGSVNSMFDSTSLIARDGSYSGCFYLGSSDAEVTIDDFSLAPLNAELTVTYLSDKSSIVHDTDNHKVIVTRAWSLTNTSTTLSVDVKEIGFRAYQSYYIWREILGEKSFTLQPLQAGTFTMTLEYNLINYSNPISSVNFLSEVI